jgi:hypothetical protein
MISARGSRPITNAGSGFPNREGEKGAQIAVALFLSLGADHIAVLELGQTGIGLEVDLIDLVIDVLAVLERG